MNTIEQIKKIHEILDKKLGEDIVVLEVKSVTTIADYFVIVSASSERQVNALQDELDNELSKLNIHTRSIEGKSSSRWILMDYGDIIVHIFKDEEREFYNLERLWKDANFVDVNQL